MRYLRFLNKEPQKPRGLSPSRSGPDGSAGSAEDAEAVEPAGPARRGNVSVGVPLSAGSCGDVGLRLLDIDMPPDDSDASSDIWVSSTSLAYSLRNSWRMN